MASLHDQSPSDGLAEQSLSRREALLGATLLALSSVTGARAQSAEPFKIIIAFPPGGTSTASMQPLADLLTAKLGAPVNLIYKPGAGGDVAAVEAAKSPADGHTLFFGHAGHLRSIRILRC